MQFDDGLENDNNEFSLDDDAGAISWQDLLSDDDSLDIDGNADKEEEAKPASNIADFDISQLQEDVVTDEDAAQEEVKEEVLKADDGDELSFEKSEELLFADDASDASEINEEIENPPVEENQTTEEAIDNEILNDDIQTGEEYSNDSYSYNSPETELLDEANDDNISLNADEVSNVLDDELLSILNEDDGEAGEQVEETSEVQNEDDMPIVEEAAPVEEEVAPSDDDGVDLLSFDEQPVDSTPETVEGEYQSEEDVVPNKEKKSLVPILIVALLLLFVAGGGYAGYMYISNSVETNVDIENPPVATKKSTDETDVPVALKKDENTGEAQKPAKKAKKKDEAKEAETEDKDKKEDKVVVQVPVGGRRNPFVPSAMFNDSVFGNLGANLTMPPEIDPDDPQAVEARKLFSISVSGIMYDPSKPSAILRFDDKDYFVQKGDRIDTYTVHLITKEYVAIRNQANIYKAYVGESFTLEPARIPASQQMKIKNGQRQYISSDDVGIKVK